MFDWYRKRKAAKSLAFEQRREEKYIKVKETFDQHTNDMLSSPCAVNGMQSCTDKCVHFSKGFVRVSYNSFDDFFYDSGQYSKCKLWK